VGSNPIARSTFRCLMPRIAVSEQGDGAFAVVDVDTLWCNRATKQLFHWEGRACKVCTKVGGRRLFLFQSGLLEY
jgi:hypothetical protein